MKYILYLIVMLTILNSCGSSEPKESYIPTSSRLVYWRGKLLSSGMIKIVLADSAFVSGDTVYASELKVRLISKVK